MSAAFTMDGFQHVHNVNPGDTVALALADPSGARSVQWRVVGSSSSTVVTPTVTPTGPAGVTASVTMPNLAGDDRNRGYAITIECRVNGGVDLDGQEDSSLTATGLLGTLNLNGRIPLAVGESFERDAVTGVAQELNDRPAMAGSLVYSSGSFSTSRDDYAPVGWHPADVVRLTATQPGLEITGLEATDAKSPKFLINVGTETITLSHANGGSASENQFWLPTDVNLVQDMMVQVAYDLGSAKWRVVWT